MATNLPSATAPIGGHTRAEILTMTNSAEAARGPDDQQLVDVASILAAGVLRLRERQSLPVAKQSKKPSDCDSERLELSGETVLSVVHGG